MEEKLTAAFILSLVGSILVLLNAIVIAVLGGILGAAFMPFLPVAGAVFFGFAIFGLIIAILMLIGSILIMTGKPKAGGILVLIFSIISLFIGGGFFIGFILGLIGGILALVCKLSVTEGAKPST